MYPVAGVGGVDLLSNFCQMSGGLSAQFPKPRAGVVSASLCDIKVSKIKIQIYLHMEMAPFSWGL